MPLGVRPFLQAFQDLCFPAACLACGTRLTSARPPLFCPGCLAAIRFLAGPLCTCCGRPFPAAAIPDHLCGACLQGRWHFSRARALFLYNEVSGRAIHALKYGRSTAVLPTFRLWFRDLRERLALSAPELILPVPLHPHRLRQRGFNQALLLARALFADQRRRIQPLILQRQRPTPPQTGLSGAVRRRNLKGAFRVAAPEDVAGRRVLLVDDVFTTGATANECARVLARAGAARIEVLTLARAED